MLQDIGCLVHFTAWQRRPIVPFSHFFYSVLFVRTHFLLLYSIQQAIEELALAHAPIPQRCFLVRRGKAGQLNIQIYLVTFFTFW